MPCFDTHGDDLRMIAHHTADRKKTVVVIGNGMVGHRFCERLVEYDAALECRIVSFCEEPRHAYDRVHLTSYFAHRDAGQLHLAGLEWYAENGVTLYVGDRAERIDRQQRVIVSQQGRRIEYDVLVLATGSAPFVPAIPGVEREGVHVYRTIEDLEAIIAYHDKARSAAVIGGGLLGLEAAKALHDLHLQTHVIEFAPRLMPRQIDDAGSRLLVKKIEALGVRVHLQKATREILGNGKVEAIQLADAPPLPVEMVVVSAGIRPRDELARQCGLAVGDRGGVLVDDLLRTSDEHVYAIGEVALHRGMIYGLVAPGYEMAEVLAANLTGATRTFTGADMSTKLKLMGVDVASFGDTSDAGGAAQPVTFEDPFRGVYKKLWFNGDGTRLLGGILVGDASDYGTLLGLYKSDGPLPLAPSDLVRGGGAPAVKATDLGDNVQICSCNNVSKGRICCSIREGQFDTVAQVKAATKAGTGCGGCIPLVTELLHAELKAAGRKVNKNLCEHFAYTRQELFQIVKIAKIRTFGELLESHGRGHGCEICKPAVASIFASLWNEHVLDHAELQDTNDRFLANIQRGGSYSVIPRIPGGEITPEKLITIGQIAKKYGLYTKLTGGQRVDMLGAPAHHLPDIWEDLVDAGFESGHAYGKAIRTVKSCVGTTWCRFAVGDSVGFAVRLELRYRGIRAPHKLKSAVSGCVRECAEAQSKDFGVIATEKGWNLYVCGNGGAQPRHADLLAADLDEDTCIRYIDRFLMYYIQTADRLTRTSKWLEAMEGGIEYLRDVIVNDRLQIAGELERQAQFLVESYRCEWREVVKDPQRRRMFRQFVNTDETEPGVEFVSERGQKHPAGWPSDFVHLQSLKVNGSNRKQSAGNNGDITHLCEAPSGPFRQMGDDPVVPAEAEPRWHRVGCVSDFPKDAGACVKCEGVQIAVYRFSSRNEWHACQNLCPHKRELVLSRGILGDQGGVPKVACPVHKKAFSLESGKCLSGEEFAVEVFPVKVVGDEVFVQVPLAQAVGREGACCVPVHQFGESAEGAAQPCLVS
jgi:nitrite reductase (NADH) large subunit